MQINAAGCRYAHRDMPSRAEVRLRRFSYQILMAIAVSAAAQAASVTDATGRTVTFRIIRSG